MIKNLRVFLANRNAVAVSAVFATVSFLYGSWVVRIPDLKENLNLSEGELGLALLGMSLGALLMMPFSAAIMGRFGTGRTMVVGIIVATFGLAFPAFANNFWVLFALLWFSGMFHGLTDVAMNAAVTTIERSQNIRIMSTCHGVFSLSGMLGALLGSVMAGSGVAIEVHLFSVALALVVLILAISRVLLQVEDTETEAGKLFVLPSGALIGIAFTGFVIMMGEGTVADWSAIYIKDYLGSTAALAGLGFAGFSFTMALGRFMGDSIVPKYGVEAVVRWGSALGALGLAAVIFIPNIFVAIAGFTMIGLGFSCVVPTLFSAAARVPGVVSGTGITSVTTSGIFGFLVGPPMMGFIAETFGLPFAFGVMLVLVLIAVSVFRANN